jgi:ankyrin repeat protein
VAFLSDHDGNTPIHWAACKGHHTCIKLLVVKYGKHINDKNMV